MNLKIFLISILFATAAHAEGEVINVQNGVTVRAGSGTDQTDTSAISKGGNVKNDFFDARIKSADPVVQSPKPPTANEPQATTAPVVPKTIRMSPIISPNSPGANGEKPKPVKRVVKEKPVVAKEEKVEEGKSAEPSPFKKSRDVEAVETVKKPAPQPVVKSQVLPGSTAKSPLPEGGKYNSPLPEGGVGVGKAANSGASDLTHPPTPPSGRGESNILPPAGKREKNSPVDDVDIVHEIEQIDRMGNEKPVNVPNLPLSAIVGGQAARPGQEAQNTTGESGLPIPRFVTFKSGEINARTGPGESYPIRWVYQRKNLPVEIIAEFKLWRKIKDFDGEQSWVHHAMVSSRRYGVLSHDSSVKSESDGGNKVAEFKRGVQVKINECKAEACEVQYGKLEGWVPKKSLWGVYGGEVFH